MKIYFIIFILESIDKNDIIENKQYFINLIKFNLLSIEATYLYVTIISKSDNIELIEKYDLGEYINIESDEYFHLNFIISDN